LTITDGRWPMADGVKNGEVQTGTYYQQAAFFRAIAHSQLPTRHSGV
jgi:hypothetical protein